MVLSSCLAWLSTFATGSGAFSCWKLVVTFLAMLSNFPKVERLAEEALLLAIMDWLAMAFGKAYFLGY